MAVSISLVVHLRAARSQQRKLLPKQDVDGKLEAGKAAQGAKPWPWLLGSKFQMPRRAHLLSARHLVGERTARNLERADSTTASWHKCEHRA